MDLPCIADCPLFGYQDTYFVLPMLLCSVYSAHLLSAWQGARRRAPSRPFFSRPGRRFSDLVNDPDLRPGLHKTHFVCDLLNREFLTWRIYSIYDTPLLPRTFAYIRQLPTTYYYAIHIRIFLYLWSTTEMNFSPSFFLENHHPF